MWIATSVAQRTCSVSNLLQSWMQSEETASNSGRLNREGWGRRLLFLASIKREQEACRVEAQKLEDLCFQTPNFTQKHGTEASCLPCSSLLASTAYEAPEDGTVSMSELVSGLMRLGPRPDTRCLSWFFRVGGCQNRAPTSLSDTPDTI